MDVPPYDDTDLSTGIYLKYKDTLDAELLEDITTTINIAFGDGYCRGYNAANAWYTQVDGDIEYINSFDSVQGVDTFNDDLVESPYGDVPNITEIELYHKMMSKEQKDSIDELVKNVKVDLNKPLDDKDE